MAFKAAAAVLKTPICLPRRGGRGRGGGRGELWLAAAAGGQRRQQHRGDGRGADRLPLLRGHQPRGQTGPHQPSSCNQSFYMKTLKTVRVTSDVLK